MVPTEPVQVTAGDAPPVGRQPWGGLVQTWFLGPPHPADILAHESGVGPPGDVDATGSGITL